ncbi:MAG: hypothetical protein WKF43_16845 [Acidimicrobiales bacterium]
MGAAGTTIDELVIGDEPAAWHDAGFEVDTDGTCYVGTVRLNLAGRVAGKGIRGWSLRDMAPAQGDARADIDGIATRTSERPPGEGERHRNGTIAIDHLVLMSPDGGRTAAAITAATGLDVRRTRDAESNGRPMRQRFFRMGEVILELVSPPAAGDGPAGFFGLTFTVADLDGLVTVYGDRMGPVKAAVQQGRRIATLRHRPLDLSVAVAFMSPDRQPRL